MVKIYCIEDCNGLKYVGSTIQKLNVRLNHHRCHDQCKSKDLDLYNSKIYTLEETDEENRKVREQYWIDNTECVNKNNVVHNRNEYNKNYREKNKPQILQQQKQYSKEYYKQTKNSLKLYHYKNSWGGDPRSHNNLLKIDVNIFKF